MKIGPNIEFSRFGTVDNILYGARPIFREFMDLNLTVGPISTPVMRKGFIIIFFICVR